MEGGRAEAEGAEAGVAAPVARAGGEAAGAVVGAETGGFTVVVDGAGVGAETAFRGGDVATGAGDFFGEATGDAPGA